ncbi:hypothetical protein HanIR_Chr10g0459111 [Helianthus annuus]|nr:hypothetical protein HanIR_Chr10g0459111 [Helianthus annuus]
MISGSLSASSEGGRAFNPTGKEFNTQFGWCKHRFWAVSGWPKAPNNCHW